MSKGDINLILTIDEVPRSPNGPNGLLRMHWARRRRYADGWYWLVFRAMGGDAHCCGELRATVRIHQVRRRLLDTDNLYASVKPVLDAMRKTGLIFDDSAKWCDLTVTQEVGRPVRTLIEME